MGDSRIPKIYVLLTVKCFFIDSLARIVYLKVAGDPTLNILMMLGDRLDRKILVSLGVGRSQIFLKKY